MKTLIKTSLLFFITIFLLSCSSVKVVNVWKNSSLENLDQKKVIVFKKTNEDFVRMEFETEIVKQLNKNNINAIESYTIFKKIDTSKNMSPLEATKFKNELKKQGIQLIMVTLLKETTKYTKTAVENELSPSYEIRYSPRFRRFYYATYYDLKPTGTTTYTGKKYTLETIIYDISKEDDQQLISVLTTEVDNPKTLGSVSKHLSKKITKHLLK